MQPALRPGRSARMSAPTIPPATILVVDDNGVLRMHAAELLREAGYKVVEAGDAAAALGILQDRADVRLIFTDVQMPGAEDGLSLAQQVKQRWPAMRLLITSGGSKIMDESLPDDARFLTKPYSDWQVLGHVKAMIDDGPAGVG